ncbi:DNA cytosine methyltransferase [Rossellomorea aquimaris]|uniref:DNA cytosine methyltransferase n=1 Tax=Rossellomorea aquimaris TaxID=189382 RepID=UPI003CF61DD0
MSTYNYIDLFSGAGGFSSGFKEAGFKLLASIELNKIYNKTHQLNFPDSISLNGDIIEISPTDFSIQTGVKKGDIDVLIGSPPCQTFSSIGIAKIKSLGKGDIKSDPRNYLFKQYFDYVKFFEPEIFVLENVPTMKTRYKGELFQKILELIKELGYEPHAEILNSVEYGVPQTRKRLIIVGVRNSKGFSFPKPTHFYNEKEASQMDMFEFTTNENRELKNATTVFDALNDLPVIHDGCRFKELQYSKNDNLTDYQKLMRNENRLVDNNICRMSNDRAKKVFLHMEQGQKYMDLPKEVRQILPFREDIFHDRLKRLNLSKPSWTVLAHIGMDGYMYIHPTENRTLSVREAARIQSFKDSFVFTGNMREQYIQVGNAVPPLLAQKIAESVKEALG